ncbi:maleylpyruvate isomerase family mycothiol-dependent enzyme [Nocardioides sp.]|uniref:maleylpyruvate isomerase family mycothiol-dependent enzyme n=1 Tax=Nocardioides sp. TaxID=35761 RepID=UPI0027348B67|nr:maleylpyruvate isomerase family mycothiol-dependent enzyme [Nocardioides sp.]MDP3892205.1 maleylpyruvate isomerase family mycothiol-dependent enzyme [Nocardioides sp.]
MTRPSPEEILQHITAESSRFREVLAATSSAAPVPACPDWTAADLLWHLGEVQWFWARVIESRPAGPESLADPDRPATHEALLTFFDRAHRRLVDALRSADPTDTAWSWADEQTVAFTLRRQAHEALIHRLDAEETAGRSTPLDPALAADGVAELLEVMHGGVPPWGTLTRSGTTVRVAITDTGDELFLDLGRFTGTSPTSGRQYDEPAFDVVDALPAGRSGPGATVAAPAAVLDTWLWRRGDAEALLGQIELTGDADALDHFRSVVSSPLE